MRTFLLAIFLFVVVPVLVTYAFSANDPITPPAKTVTVQAKPEPRDPYSAPPGYR